MIEHPAPTKNHPWRWVFWCFSRKEKVTYVTSLIMAPNNQVTEGGGLKKSFCLKMIPRLFFQLALFHLFFAQVPSMSCLFHLFFLNEGFHPRNLQGQGEWPWADNGCMYEVSLLLNRRVSRKFLDVKTCVFRGLDFILATDPVWRVVTPNRLGVAVVMDLSYDSGLFSHSLKRSR